MKSCYKSEWLGILPEITTGMIIGEDFEEKHNRETTEYHDYNECTRKIAKDQVCDSNQETERKHNNSECAENCREPN